MISHQVIKKTAKTTAGHVANYLNSEIENTSTSIARYYEGDRSCKIYEYAGEGIKRLIEEKNLTTDTDKIAYFSSRTRMGYDFTFSLAQDISLLASFDNRIRQDIQETVKKTLIPFMSVDIRTREHINGQKHYLKAQALIQVYEHHTSRELDPQLHYHMFISNEVLSEKGKFSSLSAELLVENKFFYNVLASYQITQKLQERGYNAYLDGHGNVKTSIDERIIESLSKRRQAMKEKAKELYGTDDLSQLTREQVRAIFFATRKEKEYKDLNELKDMWQEELKELGYTRESFEKSLRRDYQGELTRQDMEKAYEIAIKELEEKRGLFKKESLIQEYLIALSSIAQEKNARLPELKKALTYLRDRSMELQRIESRNRAGIPIELYTTLDYMRKEQTAFRTAITLTERPKPFAQIEEIEKAIKTYEVRKGFELTEEQRQAVYNILYGTQLSLVNGHAGAGKTTAAEIVSDMAKAKGFKIVALAPTGKAVEELSKSLKSDGYTIDSFLMRYEKGKISIDRQTILFVDEAGMVDTENMYKLLRIAEQTGAKIVLQGDYKQLKPVSAGDLYSDIYHRLKQDKSQSLTELRTIRRQKVDEYREIAKAYSEKDFQRAFDILLPNKDKYFEDYDLQRIKQEFLKDPKETLIATTTNRERETLNQEIRQELFKNSPQHEIRVRHEIRDIKELKDLAIGDTTKIGKKTYRITQIDPLRNRIVLQDEQRKEEKVLALSEIRGKTFYRNKDIPIAIGERVIALKNDRETGLKNGELFEVVDIRGTQIKLRNDQKELWVDTRKYNYFDYAYAITTHKAQGMTVKNVLIAGKDMDYNLFYVALTRGKENLKIYTRDIVDLLYKSQFPAEKKTSINAKRKAQTKALSRDQIAQTLIKKHAKEETWKAYAKYIDDLRQRQELLREISKVKEQEKDKRQEQEYTHRIHLTR